MSNQEINRIAPGYVLGFVTGQAKAATRELWEAELEKVWPKFISAMNTNPGYKGAFSTWNTDKPGEVSIVGIWESMEHRLAYEAKSSTTVRAIFNAMISEPVRYRPTVTKTA